MLQSGGASHMIRAMPFHPNAKTAFVACAAVLALPALPHLGDWFRLAYSFHDSYLGGTPAPAAWVRAADFLSTASAWRACCGFTAA